MYKISSDPRVNKVEKKKFYHDSIKQQKERDIQISLKNPKNMLQTICKSLKSIQC